MRVRRQSSRDVAVKTNANFCRLAMRQNSLDARLYEWAHRRFCERLQARGLMDDANVRRELERKGFCGEMDWSDEEAICGPIERQRESAKEAAEAEAKAARQFRTGRFES